MADLIASCLLVIGGAFTLVGAVGLARMPDFFNRLHGPSKASTLGIGGILLASLVHFNAQGVFSLKELLIALLIFVTTPVSAQMLCKAALKLKVRSVTPLPDPENEQA